MDKQVLVAILNLRLTGLHKGAASCELIGRLVEPSLRVKSTAFLLFGVQYSCCSLLFFSIYFFFLLANFTSLRGDKGNDLLSLAQEIIKKNKNKSNKFPELEK